MSASLHTIASAFKEAELTTFTGENWQPSTTLEVKFQSGVEAKLGNELVPDETKPEEPAYFFTSDDATATYTLICIDPDAPTRSDPIYSPILHVLRTGLKGAVEGAAIELPADPWMPYIGPNPPVKAGLHRYAWLLYKETATSKPLAEQELLKGTDIPARLNFPVDKFVEENKLELVAANFFIAKNPEQ